MRHPNARVVHVEGLLLIVTFIMAAALFVMSARHRSVRPASTLLWGFQDPEACQRVV
jgi:hypothetical protein